MSKKRDMAKRNKRVAYIYEKFGIRVGPGWWRWARDKGLI